MLLASGAVAQSNPTLLMSKASVNESGFCKRQGCEYLSTMSRDGVKLYDYGLARGTMSVRRRAATSQIFLAKVTTFTPTGNAQFSSTEKRILNDFLKSFIGTGWTASMEKACLQGSKNWNKVGRTPDGVKYSLSCDTRTALADITIKAI
ncbi:hypothetical protein [Deinococcus radiophilus]|uniref:hypothetical protein n=1 Tax=Deinococcus radiophilus TaxID=32062 RepID=UPI003608FF6C